MSCIVFWQDAGGRALGGVAIAIVAGTSTVGIALVNFANQFDLLVV